VGVEPTSNAFAERRLASRPQDHSRAGGGTRTHFVRVTKAVPGLSSIAGLFRAASAGVEPTAPGFKAPVPCPGPGQIVIRVGSRIAPAPPATNVRCAEQLHTPHHQPAPPSGIDPVLRPPPCAVRPATPRGYSSPPSSGPIGIRPQTARFAEPAPPR